MSTTARRARITTSSGNRTPFHVEGDAELIRGKRVLAIEDGPTLTHGEMSYGAAVLAAKQHGAAELVDPRPFAVGSIARTFEDSPDIGALLPAMASAMLRVADATPLRWQRKFSAVRSAVRMPRV